MFGLKRKIRHWQEAGLLQPGQADALLLYEKERKSGSFGRGLTALGVFAILTGVLSIIAANWEMIPAAAKIGMHGLANAAVAAILWRAAEKNNEYWREGAALALFGLSLTILALIGQVFQLDGSLSGLSVTWMVMTLPFMAVFGRTRITAVPWMLAFLATIGIVLSEVLDDLPEFWQMFYAVAVGALLPLALIADGTLRFFQRLRPAYADIFVRAGCVLLALNATLASAFWYAPRGESLADIAREAGLSYAEAYMILAGIFAAGFAGMGVHALACGRYGGEPDKKTGFIFAAASLLMAALPVLIPGDESKIAAAVTFIAYWIFIGWIGQQMAWSRLISLAIVLVALRIFAVYVEVFGSMLSTGIGLITGGCVLLGLIWAARRMNRRLTKGGAHD